MHSFFVSLIILPLWDASHFLIPFGIKVDTLNSKVPMRVGKFLNKEFNEYLGFTIDDLKVFNELFNELDKEHLYEKRIYEYYIENNKFELTE